MPVRLLSREWIIAGAVACVVLFAGLFFGLRSLEYYVTYHPVPLRANEGAPPAEATDVWLTTKDGVRLHGWFFHDAERTPVASLIFFHGNGGNITNIGWLGQRFFNNGFDVLLIDYRGYGKSEGEIVSEWSLYSDAEAAFDFLLQRGVKPESIAIYGHSLGSAVGVDLASRRGCGALVVEAGFSSASELASEVLPWIPRQLHFLTKSRFANAEKMKNVRCPVLVTHGEPDHTIPTSLGRNLYAAANEPRRLLILPGAGHIVFGAGGDTYLKTVTDFLLNCRGSAPWPPQCFSKP